MTPLPIVVDLDDTLAKTDFFFESLLLFVKQNPINLFHAFIWLLKKDRAYLKTRIAEQVDLNVASIPYNQQVVEWIKNKKQQGHEIILATASDNKFAQAVADHLGLFDQVLATENGHNLKGANKEKRLIELFGLNGFIYVGDSKADLNVWRSAKAAVYVGSNEALKQQIHQITTLDEHITKPFKKRSIFKAIRVHQWVKNTLIFVPLLTSHNFNDLGKLSAAILAFLAFSFCASAVYILNDFFDLEDDRRHRTKCKRAFASGELGIIKGCLILFVCLLCSLILSLIVGSDFFLVVLIYFIMTLLYSLILKSKMMIDIIILAGLYTIRIFAGAIAIEVELSFWLLAFSMFIFLSLATMKRYIEISVAKNAGHTGSVRGYQLGDIDMLSTLGTASGFVAVLIMAFYVNSPEITDLYRQPQFLWLVCPILLFWTGRTWLQARRGNVDDDPVLYVIKDTVSWLCIFSILLSFFVAM